MILLLLSMRWLESSITEIYAKNINRVYIKQYFISPKSSIMKYEANTAITACLETITWRLEEV